jgi:hypothetical protein
MNTSPHTPTQTATAFDQEEAAARLGVGVLAVAVYVGLWLYGGASWGSFWVAALLGTFALLVLSPALGIAVFVLIKALRLVFKPRAPL